MTDARPEPTPDLFDLTDKVAVVTGGKALICRGNKTEWTSAEGAYTGRPAFVGRALCVAAADGSVRRLLPPSPRATRRKG